MEDKRVIVTKGMVGICHMQVCAMADATDEEILAVCNQRNPSGTTNGWMSVIRENTPEEDTFWPIKEWKPVTCQKFPERKHFIVGC